jgi:hypothetical protein
MQTTQILCHPEIKAAADAIRVVERFYSNAARSRLQHNAVRDDSTCKSKLWALEYACGFPYRGTIGLLDLLAYLDGFYGKPAKAAALRLRRVAGSLVEHAWELDGVHV